jgi:hypothetical protein
MEGGAKSSVMGSYTPLNQRDGCLMVILSDKN